MIEPIGLEELSGNNFFPCMEAGISASFNPVFNTGMMAFNNVLDKRMTWAAGIFKDTGAFGDSVSNEEFAVTARITGLPYHADDGRRYAHFAYAMSHRELNEEGYRIRARPDSFISPSVLDTGVINAEAADLVGFESLITFGSLSLQSEWVMTSTELVDAETSDADFAGYYVLLSYFLTGEHRPYNKSTGTFTRITPKRNATGKTWGSGAWELVGRYGELDLNDSGIEGGQLATTTLGLNWYLNPNSRIMWNYVMADVENTGDVDIFQMRFQFDL
jgi:phosphate-selective porin OprO/OprP